MPCLEVDVNDTRPASISRAIVLRPLSTAIWGAAVLITAIVLLIPARAQEQTFTGQWLLDRAQSGSARFELRYEASGDGWSRNNYWSTDVPVASLQGLNLSDLASSAGATVRFKLVRDAGDFNCEGWAHDGNASGHWTFVPSPSYAAALKQRGIAAPLPREQFDLAMSDVTLALVDELKSEGYPLSLGELIRAGKHGVSLEYVQGMKQAGYRFSDLETLTRMRDHGVTPTYVQQMAAYGFKNLSADDLRRLRDHGVTADYLHAMEQAGYKNLSSEDAVHLRDHGVTPEFIAAMVKAGYTGLSADELSRMRDHGVTPDFIAAMAQAGYAGLPAYELSRLRDHGVTADYIRDMAQVGLTKLEPAELTRLRDHGVTASYVRELKDVGVVVGEAHELARLRDYGVDASFVREAKARGFSTSDPEELIRLRTRGLDARATVF